MNLDEFIGSLKVSEDPELEGGQVAINDCDAAAWHLDGSPIVLLRCSRRTTVIVTKKNTVPRGELSMDSSTCRNARADVGMTAGLYRIEPQRATRVTFTPILAARDRDLNLIHDFLHPALTGVNEYRCLHIGDKFVTESEDQSVAFLVAQLTCNNDDVKYAYINADTGISLSEPMSLDAFTAAEKNAQLRYKDIGGCKQALDAVKELVELPLKNPEVFRKIGGNPPQGILLFGPPGTGKTRIARAVANETGAFFLLINGPEVIAAERGASEKKLRTAFELAARNAPSIIFIDEIDSIAPSREQSSSPDERRMVTMLLTLMDGMISRNQVVVIAATNRPNSLDPALRRFGRFDREVDVGVPDEAGRLELLRIHTGSVTKLSDEVKNGLGALARETHGYVGADIAQLCTEAVMNFVRQRSDQLNAFDPSVVNAALNGALVTMEHFRSAMKKMTPSALRETKMEKPNVSWDSISGMEKIKQELDETFQYPIKYPHLYAKFGMTPAKGILLYGPPGCGKTLLARAVASQCDANFISIKGPELLTMWYGESEANIRRLFDRARSAAPCIIFFDEIDSITSTRGGGSDNGSTDRVINQLLTEMDGLAPSKDVFIIGATNRPDIIDPAIKRPGRLDKLIEIPLPDDETRLSIMRSKLQPAMCEPTIDVCAAADKLKGFSGAEVTAVCQRAAAAAISAQIAATLRHKHHGEAPDILISQEMLNHAQLVVMDEKKRRDTTR